MPADWIKEIKNHKLQKWSQCGEEGYINFILDNIGYGKEKFLVDLGASDGYSLSNTRIFIDSHDYQHILIDYKDGKGVFKEFITKENVLELLSKYNCPEEFSLLSIDLDGNDWDILNEVLTKYKPRLIIAEVNGTIPEGTSVKMKYDPKHIRIEADQDYFGFSLTAGIRLADATGYRVIFQNDSMNMYFVRRDLLEDPDQIIDLNFKAKPYYARNSAKAHLWVQV